MSQYVDNYSNNRSDITSIDQDTVIMTNKNEESSSIPMSMSTTPSKKLVKLTMFNRFLGQFDPFNFIFNMGIGISSTLLYSFPYPAHWLEICSYIMFAVNVLLFIFQQFMFFLHFIYFSKNYSTKQYFDKYFRNLTKSVFWGTYPMGLVTIINYIYLLGNYFYTKGRIVVAKRIFRLVYVLWWYDIVVSMFIAWGITFLIWQNYYFQDGLGKWNFKFEKVAAEHLKSILLLAVIPLVVGSSSVSIFIMSDLATITLNRNVQLLTMVIATLLWLHAIIFVFILVGIYFWSLYIFKIPPMSQVFTMFLVLGPMGQGAYGILLLTDNVLLYTQEYYSKDPTNILLLSVPWSFKVLGLILSMSLLSMGYFFTFITLLAIISYSKRIMLVLRVTTHVSIISIKVSGV
ncbi:Ssu1p PWA37_000951 [Arxiozyma heterogenica]|uniref:Ssu1p n=1 Tax=Arxiozyma heterogenica TaxID=278026 RepID=UPI002EED9456